MACFKKIISFACLVIVFGSCIDHPEADHQITSVSGQFLADAGKSGLTCEFEGFDFPKNAAGMGVRCIAPVLQELYGNINEIPDFGVVFCERIENGQTNPTALLHDAFSLLGCPAGGVGPPLSGTGNYTGILITQSNHIEVIDSLKDLCGFEFDEGNKIYWDKLPVKLRTEILRTLFVVHTVHPIISDFTLPIVSELQRKNLKEPEVVWEWLMDPFQKKELTDFSMVGFIENADLRKLSFASRMLCQQMEKLMAMTIEISPDVFRKITINTDYGQVGIFGSGRDTIADDFMMTVDLGGDDYYSGHQDMMSRAGFSQVKIILDLNGNDNYEYEEGLLAAGMLGVSLLFDGQGDDTYFSNRPGLAGSLFGTSVLYDRSGNDIYKSSSDYSQASAIAGVALLVDGAGNDCYESRNFGQGFAGPRGAAFLIDFDGNDTYNAQPEHGSNTRLHFVQGASKGRWAEASDGHSLGGGFGVLMDMSGDDHYSAGSFSQGASYFFGFGFLYDGSGSDNYNAQSHSQGYAAHYGLSLFIEKSGDDMYNQNSDDESVTQIIGSGRDLSAGWFIELGGDDTYHFGNRSLGIGDLNGFGVAWDAEGDDTYFWRVNHLNEGVHSMGNTVDPGMMGISRTIITNLNPVKGKGIFLDCSGSDKFEKVLVEK